jgi:hypothetical protein
MREHRPAHTDLPPEELRRARVRGYASVYQRRGLLVPQPCEVCGSADVEKHHEDYDYPLLVRWRCREHHLDLHYTWRPLRRRERPTPRLPFEASPQLGLF